MSAARSASARQIARGLLMGGCAVWLLCATPAAATADQIRHSGAGSWPALNQSLCKSGREILYTPGVTATKPQRARARHVRAADGLECVASRNRPDISENNGAILIQRAEDATSPKRGGGQSWPDGTNSSLADAAAPTARRGTTRSSSLRKSGKSGCSTCRNRCRF